MLEKVIRIVFGIVVAVIAAIGFAAEFMPALGFAKYSAATFHASKEIAQWASRR